MDTHERFMSHRTTEADILLELVADKHAMMLALVHKFSKLLLNFERHYVTSLKFLETMRTVLCLFYKEKQNAKAKGNVDTNPMYRCYASAFTQIDMDQLIALSIQPLDAKILSVLLDIFVLYTTLYENLFRISDSWKTINVLINEYSNKGMEINSLEIRLIDCYMNALLLHRMSGDIEPLQANVIAAPFLNDIFFWLGLDDSKKNLLLTQVLPKLIKFTNHSSEITNEIWQKIFHVDNCPMNILTTLTLTADIWFPTDAEYDKQLMEQTTEEPLWLLLLKGLSSSIPQQRKQALYLIKRIVDFTDKHNNRGLELGKGRKIRPLICIGNESQQALFKKNLNNYILTLEALEEKQKHLVTPVFPLLKTLLNERFDEEHCKTGLHIAWIRCAFQQILQHDNNAVVKWGVQNVLTLDPELYNDEFLSQLLDVLNRTWLYENDVDSEEPVVVKELVKLLNNAEIKKSDLLKRFLMKASQMTWGPVALFHVIHSLSMVQKLSSTWRKDELEAVRSLAELNLTMHCRMLRVASQIELLETMTHFATESLDLVLIANTLSAFSTNEALNRGQLAWNRTTVWLSKIIKRDEALRFIEDTCERMTNENLQRELSTKTFSLMIMLLHDGLVVLDSKSCPGLVMLRNLLNCLIGADSRPYGNVEMRNRSMQLMYHLMEFTSSKDYVLRELISNYADASLRFIFKSLQKISDEAHTDDIDVYVSITQQLFTSENSIISKREILNHTERFEVEVSNIIEDAADSHSMKKFFGIKMLYVCLKAASTKVRNYSFIGPLYNSYTTLMTTSKLAGKTLNTRADSRNLGGKIAAEYYKHVAQLFYEYVKDVSPDEWVTDIDWIDQASYLIQVGGNDIFLPVVGLLSQIFHKEFVKPTDIDYFKSTVRLCWNSILESNECRLATEEIVGLIFSSPFIECKETRELTIECAYEMADKADKIPGLSVTLLKGLEQVEEKYLSNFYEVILVCLLQGTVPRRDQKIELQALLFVLNRYQRVYPNYFANTNVNTSAATRAHAVTVLQKVITDEPSHGCQFLSLVAKKLNESQNKRYFADSQMHRLKNRIMQVLLVLQPILQTVDVESLYTLTCNNILSESSQPSVRIMQEWLLVRIYLENETLCNKIWDLITQGKEKRVGSLCSVLSIVYHVARLLSSELQPDFMDQALQYILPCCMAQQFNVRLYAQVIASKLYNLASELSYLMITNKYRELYAALTESLKHGNLMKNSIKLQDDFYFTVFNPIDDYSLLTIFYELPRLSNVSSDEFISAQTFEKLGFKESKSHPLKLLNNNGHMSEAQVSAHILKSSGSAGPIADENEVSSDCSSDMQKKFIPWKSMIPNENFLNEMSDTALTFRQKASSHGENIILIASLIDKLPNLGGLSRTCEILGVGEFVVPSIKQTEDKEFQSLSVSAEKMITLTEVKPHQLQQYLLEKKDAGYRLVGAEQTVNSTNLMDMKFDRKTVLLLGNEKAGIPADLIPLLDVCVEIPQVGVVRSFNVHVTGAICLWEYFKQHRSP